MPASLDEQFAKAVKLIQSLPKEGSLVPDTSTKLKYYAFYKQATVGKVNIPQPGIQDITGRAKWDAWNGLGDMSKEAAKQGYVNELAQGLVEPESDTDAEIVELLNDFRSAVGK